MSRTLILAVALLASLSAGCQRTHPGAPSGTQNGTQGATSGASQGRAQTVTLYDPLLHNIPAATLQIPAGWRIAGSAIHPVCGMANGEFQFRIESPDGSIVIQKLLPFFTLSDESPYSGLNFNTCGVEGPPMAAGVVLTRYIMPTLGRGIKPGALEVAPESDPAVQAMHMRNGNTEARGSMADQPFDYTDARGRPMGAVVIATTNSVEGGGSSNSATQLLVIAATAANVQQSMQVFKSIKLQMLPAWQQQSVAFANEFRQEQIASLQQRGRDQNEASTRRGEANRAALRQQGDARMAAIQADMQFHLQQSVAFANQTIENIHATGNASMNNARTQQQNMDDNTQRFIGHIADKPVSFKWCSASGGVAYSEYPPPGNWQHCQ